MIKLFLKKTENSDPNFLNRVIIGFAYGLIKSRDLILRKNFGFTPQDAMDFISIGIGREIVKELLAQKVVNKNDDDEKLIGKLTEIMNLAEELNIRKVNEKIQLVVQKCLICPKRIGGYDLEGFTACPIGGIIVGALTYVRGLYPEITKNKLEIAEICHIQLEYN